MDNPIAQAVEDMAWIDEMRDENAVLRTKNARLEKNCADLLVACEAALPEVTRYHNTIAFQLGNYSSVEHRAVQPTEQKLIDAIAKARGRRMSQPSIRPVQSVLKSLGQEIDNLRAENGRFRVALERIAGRVHCRQAGCILQNPFCNPMIARAALKGEGDE